MEDNASHARDRVLTHRHRLRRFQRIPMRYVIPNLVTLAAICLLSAASFWFALKR